MVKIQLNFIILLLSLFLVSSFAQAQSFNSRQAGGWNTASTWITANDLPFTITATMLSTTINCSSNPIPHVAVGDVLVTSADAAISPNSTITAITATTITINTMPVMGATNITCRVRKVPTAGSAVNVLHAVGVPIAAVNIASMTVNAGASVTIGAQNFTVTGITANTGTITDNNNGGVTNFTGVFTNNAGATFTSNAVTTQANLVFGDNINNNAGATSFAAGGATMANGITITSTIGTSFSNGIAAVGNFTATGGTMTISGGNSNIAGDLVVSPGATLTVSTIGTFQVTGAFQNNGTFTDNNNTAGTTFTGLVTNNGTFTTTLVTTTANMRFNGGFTNNVTTFAVRTATFGAGTTLTAVSSISFPAAVVGMGGLTIAGTGGVTLAGGNCTVAGNLTINAGASLSVTTTGTFQVTGTTQNDGSFTDANNTTITAFTGLVTNTGSITTTAVTTAANMVFTGGITHAGGTMSLQTATFGAGSVITAALPIAIPSALSSIGALTITGAGGLTLAGNGNSGIGGNLIIDLGATLTIATTGTLLIAGTTQNNGTFVDNNNTAATTFSGLVTNAGTFTTTAVTTTANLVFNGGLTNASGTLSVANATIGAARTITANTAINFAGGVTANGNLTIAGTAGVTFAAGTCSVAGNLLIDAGASVVVATAGVFQVNGTTQNNGNFTDTDNTLATAFIGLVTNTGNFITTNVITTANMRFDGGFTHASGTFTVPVARLAGTITATSPVNFTGSASNGISSNGTAAVIFAGAGGTTLSGGNGVFGGAFGVQSGSSFTLATSGTFSITGASAIDGTLVLSNGIYNNNSANTTFGATAILSGTPGASSMIVTSGSVIKLFDAPGSFIFPVGTGTVYTPAIIDITSATFTGASGTRSVSVRPVAGNAPNQLDATYSLTKYWIISTANLSNIAASLNFTYNDTEANASVETFYTGAQYAGALPWIADGTVDPAANTISFTRTGVADLNGNWTAGPPSAFAATTFYSRASGNWESPSTWSTVALGGAASGTLPTSGSSVVIGNSNTVTVTSSAAKSVNVLQLDNSGVLDMGAQVGLTITTFNGTGTLRMGAPVWPTITTNNFIATAGSTVEYANTTSYTLPAGFSSCQNLIISGTGGVKTLGATTIVNGSLVIASGTLQLAAQAFNVKGTTSISGTLNDNNTAGTNLLEGLVTLNASGSWTTTNNPAFTFRGGLLNNGTMATTGTGVYTFNTNNQSIAGNSVITFQGAVQLSGGITINNHNTGIVTIIGPLDGDNAASTWVNDIGSTLAYANANLPFVTSGVLDASANANTVNYSFAGAQPVRATSYHHLSIAGGAIKTLQGNTTINGNLTVANGTLEVASFNISVAGTSTLTGAISDNSTTGTNTFQNVSFTGGNIGSNPTATFLINGNLSATAGSGILAQGNFTITGSTNIAAGRSLVFNSGLGNKIFSGDITLDGTWNATAAAAFNIDGNLTVGSAATFLPSTGLYTFGGAGKSIGGTIATLGIANMAVTGTVTSALSSLTINTLNISAAGVLTSGPSSAITINTDLLGAGTFTQSANSTLNVLSANGISVTVLNATALGNTVNYNRNNTQPVKATTYHHLVLSNANVKTAQGNLVLNGDLTVAIGVTLDLGTVASTVTVGGAAAVSGAVTFNGTTTKILSISGNLSGLGTISMNGALPHEFNLGGAANSIGAFTSSAVATKVNYTATTAQEVFSSLNYRLLTIGGGGVKTLHGAVTANNGINITAGTLALNSFTLTSGSNVTIAATATLDVNANATLQLGAGAVLANNGTLMVVGTPGNLATVTRTGAGTYSILQNAASAVFHARHYAFNYLGGSGITISNGQIDATNNFSNGSFSNNTGTQSIDLSGLNFTPDMTVTSVVFNAGPTYNVSRTSGSGVISFEDATGVLAGENFDNDNGNPGLLIEWTNPSTTFYSQGTGLFGNLSNWNRSAGGGGANPSAADLTNGLASFVVQNGHTITLNQDVRAMELTIGNGVTGTLILGDNTTPRTLRTDVNLTVRTGANIVLGSADATHLLDVRGNFRNAGNVNLRFSTVRIADVFFNGSSTQISGAGTTFYNNVTFGTNASVTANVPMNINGYVSLLGGSTFNDGGLTHTVTGDWIDGTSGQLIGSGTIQLNSTTSQTIQATSAFNNLTLNGSGSVTFTGAVAVAANFVVSNSTTVSAGANVTHTFASGFLIQPGSIFNQTAGIVDFNGLATQTIDASNAVFYNVSFTNGGIANPKSITGNLVSTNQVHILNSAAVDGLGNHIFANFRQEGACNFSGQITFTGGTIYNNVAAALSLGTADIIVAGNQFVQAGNLVTTGGNANITSGYLVLNNNSTFTGISGNTLALSGTSSLYIRGSNNFPTGFSAYTLAPTSFVRYDQNFAQVVRGGITYGNLNLDNNTKTVDGSCDINGSLNLGGNVSADFRGYPHTIEGNINSSTGCVFQNNQTITMDHPDGDQAIGQGAYTFNNLIFTSTAPTASIRTKTIVANIITVNGNFSATNAGGSPTLWCVLELSNNVVTGSTGTFTLGAYVRFNTSGATSFETSMNSFAFKLFDVNSTLRFYGGNQNIPFAGLTYGNLEIQNNGDKVATGALDINGNLARVGGNVPVFVDGGFSHTVAGNFDLADVFYPAPTAGSTITFDGGNQIIGPANNDINFANVVFAGTGTKTFANTTNNNAAVVNGNLIIADGVVVDFNDKPVRISGNWATSGAGTGTFTQIATTTFLGIATNQSVSMATGSYFGNVAINKPTTGFQTLTALTDITIAGTLGLAANNALFDATGRTIRIGGNLNYNTGTSIIPTGSTFLFNGNSSQAINNNQALLTFNHISFSGTGSKLLNNNPILVDGNVSIAGGAVFNANNQQVSVNGNWNNSGSFQHTSVVNMTGGNQSISNSNFNSLNLAGTNTKLLAGNISLSGNLTIASGSTLDISSSNFAVSVSGNWTNNGSFTSQAGTVTLNGVGKTITTGGSGTGKSFYNVTLAMATGQNAGLAGDLDVNNHLNINTGTLVSNAFTILVGGNFVNTDGFNQNSNAGSLTFKTSVTGTRILNPGTTGSVFRRIVVDATGGVITLSNSLTLTNNQPLTLLNGTFKTNGNVLTMSNGNITIAAGATLDIDAGTEVYLADNASILNSGGTLRIVGTSATYATIQRNGGTAGQGYTITQTSGTIHARYYSIQNTKGAGATVSGGTIDAINNFSNGTFSGGAGTQYLLLSGLAFADFTVSSVVFNPGPTYNVTRLAGSGIVYFDAATGSLAGPGFENDVVLSNFIRWTAVGKRWSNATADNNWHTPGNWVPVGVPTISDTIYLDHTIIPLGTAYTVNINTANADAYRLIIDRQGGTGAITLALSGARTLNVQETLNLLTGNILSAATNNDIINIGGNWVSAGTFINGNSTVNFTGATGSYNISPGAAVFHHLTINGGAAYTSSGILNVAGNLTISNGSLDVSSSNYAVNVSGNWLNSGTGTFVPRLSTVSFNNTGAQSISGGPFYNFVTSGSGVKTVLSVLDINLDLTIGAGTSLDAGAQTIFVARNWNNNAAAGFTQTGAGTVIFDGGNQTIDNGLQSSTFNNIILAGTIANTKLLSRNLIVNGDLTATASTVITLDLQNFSITGNAAKTFTLAGSNVLLVRGSNNFPTGFGTVNLASSSTVQYRADLDQSIYATTYGNLSLATNSTTLHTATALGAITVQGNFNISDVYVQLNMNNNNVDLAGNLGFAAGGRQMLWGTGTLTHNGGNWTIDADITGFSPDFGNLVFSGTGTKTMSAALILGGDASVQSGVTLDMRTFRLTSIAAAKSFTLANGSQLNCAVQQAAGIAFPTGFASYAANPNSLVILNGTGDQTVFTGLTYGNLYLSNSTINTTLLGNLLVAGNFYTRGATLLDGGFNLTLSGAINDVRNYLPSLASTITLSGTSQSLFDGNNTADVDIANIVFTNVGTKVLGSAAGVGNTINITGNVTINSGATVTDSRNTNFSGTSWTNNGTFTHSANTFNFNGAGTQTVNAGSANTYSTVAFTNTASVSFVSNGLLVNGGFSLDAATSANMGALTHTIRGNVSNLGTWSTSAASFIFSGNNQTIATPQFIAKDILISGNNTKTMGCNWEIRNLLIDAGATLTATTAPYNLSLTGSWTNNGGFNHNNNLVAFESDDNIAKTITAGASAFNNVTFNQFQTGNRNYTLVSPSTIIANTLTLGSGAVLDLNSTSLTLGSNNGLVEAHYVQAGGTLKINSDAALRINNSNGNSTLNVAGTLIAVGTSGHVATITRSAGTARTDIDITGTIKAQYYYFEFLSDNGMNIQSTASIDAADNLSNGTWANISTAGGTPKYYLVLNAPNPTTISNITFNFGGTPVVGVHYNVHRAGTATGTLTFIDPVSGILGSFMYESDPSDVASPNASSGKCLWPVPNIVTWTGATNRDWHVTTNWSPATVPTALIDALIPDAANDPLIVNANAVCRNLTLTNGQLGLENGFDLDVNKDVVIATGTSVAILQVFSNTSDITVAGAWTRNANGQFVHGSSRVKFTGAAGAYTIAPLTSPFYHVEFNGTSSNFYLSGTEITILGNMDILNGTVYPSTTNYNLNLSGNFNNLGTFNTVANGTLKLKGGAQLLTNLKVNNVSVEGAGIKTTLGTDTINGTLNILSGATLRAGFASTLHLNNNVTINAGGAFDDGGNLHTFSGTTWTGAGSYVSGTGTITFNRNNIQYINGGAFNNLILSGNNSKHLAGNVSIHQDVTVKNTVSYLNLATYTMNGVPGTGAFTLENGTTLYVRGANNCPSNYLTYNFDPASLVIYDGALDQTIGGISYGTLTLQNANVKTLGGNITVAAGLNIGNSTLDASTSNYNINVGLSFNNSSTGSFIARNGTVTLDGASTGSIVNGVSGTKSFFNVFVNKPAGIFVNINRDVAILNDLRIINGIYNNNGANITSVGGDLVAVSGRFNNSGTYLLNKVSGTANIKVNGSTLSFLTINAPGSTYTLQDNLIVEQNFILTAGTFDGNGKYASLGSGGTKSIAIAGTYKVGAGGTLALSGGSSLNVTSTGVMEVVGVLGNLAMVTRSTSTGYNFSVDGLIKANHYLFEYMSALGIQINAGGVIDAANNFSNGAFTNGASGGTLLRIENAQTMTISNVDFPTNPGGGSKNITKITGTAGVLTFDLATGVFAGAAFESDPSNLIFWTGPITLTWNGSVSSDWYTANNWTASSGPSMVPTGVEDVIIDNAGTPPVISLDGARTNKLTINSSAILTINTPFATAPDVVVNGDFLNNGFLQMSGLNDTLTVRGNWTVVTGTFSAGTGTVIMASPSGVKSIRNGSSLFNHLVIDGSSTFQLGANTVVNRNLTVVQGTLDVTASNYSLVVRGNWLNGGTFNPRTGSVTLASAAVGTVLVNTGGSSFYNLNISPSTAAVYQVTGNPLRINANASVASGTLEMNGMSFFMGDGTGSDNLSIAGILDVTAGSVLRMGANASFTVTAGGLLKLVGTSASNLSQITHQAGNYSAIVDLGGTIQARHYAIDFINSLGVQVKPGAFIDAVNNFSDGVFSNGASGGSYLTLENTFADFTASNVIFNNGPQYNITRLIGSGVVNLLDAAGAVAGFYYENDDASSSTGRVTWSYTFPIANWTGFTSTDWNTASNWDIGVVPTATINVVIPDVSAGSTRNPVLSTLPDGNVKNITVFSGANVLLDGGTHLTVDGSFTVNSGGTFAVATTSASNIYVNNLWSVNGSFTPGASAVYLQASTGVKSLTTGSGNFNHLIINGGATFRTLSPLTMNGNFSLLAGTFEVTSPSHQLTVRGDWNNVATFIHGNGVVSFNKTTGAQQISGNATSFYDVAISTTGSNAKTVTANTDLNIDGSLAITGINAQLSAPSRIVNIKRDWNNGGKAFDGSNGTINFIGTTQQNILRNAGELFHHVTINNNSGISPQVFLQKPVQVNGILTLTRGTLASGTNNLSINLEAGAIAPAGTGSISGELNVFRNISSGYHLISSPLNGATYADINDNILLSSSNIFYYNETDTRPHVNYGWTPAWNSVLSTPLSRNITLGGPNEMNGYSILFSQPSTKLDIKGTYDHVRNYYSGALSYTPSGTPDNDGWHMIGNPYPSYIDWKSPSVDKPNVDPGIIFYNQTIGQNTGYIEDMGMGEAYINGGSPYIPPMQGFWVKTRSAGAYVNILKGARTVTPIIGAPYNSPSFYRIAASEVQTIKLAAGTAACLDETIVRFGKLASNDYDPDFDLQARSNSGSCPTLYTTLQDKDYSINSMPELLVNAAIDLNYIPAYNGEQNIKIRQLTNFKAPGHVILQDNLTGKRHDFTRDSVYSFSANISDNVNRFKLVFSEGIITKSVQQSSNLRATIKSHGSKVQVELDGSFVGEGQLMITNLLGQQVYQSSISFSNGKTFINTNASASGVYVAKLVIDGHAFTARIYLDKGN